MGAPVAALFTHEDDPHEEIWWRSCADLARRHGVPVYTPERLDQPWIERIAAMRPAIIYSFYYRNLLPDAILRIGAARRVQPARLAAAGLSRPRAGQLDAGQWRARGRRDAASHGRARRRRRYRGSALGRDRRRRHGADALPQAGAARRRAAHRDASADRRRARATPRRRTLRVAATSAGAAPRTGESIGDGPRGASSISCAP